jgi:Flp pilus assembly pilin Flp
MRTRWFDPFREEGQDIVEYALLVALVALACVAALASMSGAIDSVWLLINSRLAS